MDLFFEVPSPPPGESYLYNIALSPVHVDFDYHGFVFFPNIPFDWMGFFNHHLRQGWRLIDIYIDFPMVEQVLLSFLPERVGEGPFSYWRFKPLALLFSCK